MGSRSKGGGGGRQAATPQSMYGGTAMPQAQAQQQYQTDLANWRAPTTSATMTPAIQKNPVPVTPTAAFGSDGGPPLPGVGVPIAAPVAIQQRNNLASMLMRRQPYQGGRGGERGSQGGGAQGGPGGFGGSSARGGGLY